MTNKQKGSFIVLDGGDGCGKSTQCRMLSEWLGERGKTVKAFRDPGTTFIGEKIRKILLDPAHLTMDVRTELLLYMAARAQLWQEEIRPAIEEGLWVVMDRWVSSTCAYQGSGGGFGIANVIDVANHCLEQVWPDITIILDVDLATAAMRMDRKLDRVEQKGSEYHEKVRQGFLELPRSADNITIVDATQDIETVYKEIKEAVTKRFSELK